MWVWVCVGRRVLLGWDGGGVCYRWLLTTTYLRRCAALIQEEAKPCGRRLRGETQTYVLSYSQTVPQYANVRIEELRFSLVRLE